MIYLLDLIDPYRMRRVRQHACQPAGQGRADLLAPAVQGSHRSRHGLCPRAAQRPPLSGRGQNHAALYGAHPGVPRRGGHGRREESGGGERGAGSGECQRRAGRRPVQALVGRGLQRPGMAALERAQHRGLAV